MFDRLWILLAPRFRVACVRDLRGCLLRMGRIDLHPTFSDPDCCDWENEWLMGGEL